MGMLKKLLLWFVFVVVIVVVWNFVMTFQARH